jgi:hypothetical protein
MGMELGRIATMELLSRRRGAGMLEVTHDLDSRRAVRLGWPLAYRGDSARASMTLRVSDERRASSMISAVHVVDVISVHLPECTELTGLTL